jgi:hypothetical protein
MFDHWTEREIGQYLARKARMDAANAVKAAGGSVEEQATAAGVSIPTLYRDRIDWQAVMESGEDRMFLRGKSSGRPPLANPTPEDVRALQAEYLRSNRTRESGSATLAARFLAQSGALSKETTAAILKPRASKHSIPQTIRDAMRVPPQLVGVHRAPDNERLNGFYCPGSMRLAADENGESRRLLGGERQSWDDGSINMMVCVPWPWGGDKCADKFGVKVGRFQLLAGIDDATDFCPGFSFVMRAAQSYRAPDAMACCFRTWRDIYRPDSVMFEGGSWQAGMSTRFLEAAGVKMLSAKGRPHQKLIENYWGRLWSVLSLQDGQIGRYRGEMERENAEWMRAREGRVDPRSLFPALQGVLTGIGRGIGYLNQEQVESRIYGKWVPAHRHAADLQERPRAPLDRSLAWLVAPEQHERKVRRGMVTARAMSPFGVTFPYHFAGLELIELEGCQVRVCFDPWDSPLRATIVLAQNWHGRQAGEIVTHMAECLNSAPEIFERSAGELELGMDTSALDRAIKMRRAVWQALRTEYRAIGADGKRQIATETEIKGPDASRLRAGSMPGDGAGAELVAAQMPLVKERDLVDLNRLAEFEAHTARMF